MHENMILMMPKNNKVAFKITSTNIQRLSIASRLIEGCFNKQALFQD